MSNYTKSTNFATKDNLTPGDPLKIVRGTEIDTEFNNIATAIATKTDNASAAITGGTINDTTIGATTASTGAFTTISATGAITSTLATGTAPLVVASTTKVTNLNVDSLDGADWASPAALGSTTPAAVSATTLSASGNLTLSGGTANGVAYLNGSKVVTSGSALTFDGTNLGVGVSSPNQLLDVRGANGIGIRFLETSTGNTNRVQLGTGSGFGYIDATAGSGSTALAFQVASSEQMRLTSTGLGIGTSSPSYKLDVAGAARSDSWIGRTNGSAPTADCAMYRPADNSLGFSTANTERMRLDSSGNIGLGVTPSAWSGYKPLQAGSAASFGGYAGDVLSFMGSNTYNDNTNWKYILSGNAAARYQQSAGTHAWYTAPSGTAGNAITFTQAMTLDVSGNLNVGRTTTVNNARFMSAGSSVAYGTEWGDTKYMSQMYFNSEYYIGVMANAANRELRLESNSGDALARITFYTGASGTTSERARIDSSGNLLVGTTSAISAGKYSSSFAGATENGIILKTTLASTGSTYIGFVNSSGSIIGSVNQNGASTVAYNTSSDYRLKNTIAPMTGALGKVALLKPCTYKWNADGSDGEGFIAHELAEVVPQCVTGEKDAVDEEGNPKYQGIDTSFLVATLTAALQELNAKFDAYVASHP